MCFPQNQVCQHSALCLHRHLLHRRLRRFQRCLSYLLRLGYLRFLVRQRYPQRQTFLDCQYPLGFLGCPQFRQPHLRHLCRQRLDFLDYLVVRLHRLSHCFLEFLGCLPRPDCRHPQCYLDYHQRRLSLCPVQ